MHASYSLSGDILLESSGSVGMLGDEIINSCMCSFVDVEML